MKIRSVDLGLRIFTQRWRPVTANSNNLVKYLLVNCAGIIRDTTFRKMDTDHWEAVINTNLTNLLRNHGMG